MKDSHYDSHPRLFTKQIRNINTVSMADEAELLLFTAPAGRKYVLIDATVECTKTDGTWDTAPSCHLQVDLNDIVVATDRAFPKVLGNASKLPVLTTDIAAQITDSSSLRMKVKTDAAVGAGSGTVLEHAITLVLMDITKLY